MSVTNNRAGRPIHDCDGCRRRNIGVVLLHDRRWLCVTCWQGGR
jgi:hypothetical protein